MSNEIESASNQTLKMITAFILCSPIIAFVAAVLVLCIPLIVIYLFIQSICITYVSLMDWCLCDEPLKDAYKKHFKHLRHWWTSGTCN